MKNNTLLLLSLLGCTQFAMAMEVPAEKLPNPDIIKYGELIKRMAPNQKSRANMSISWAKYSVNVPLKGIVKSKKRSLVTPAPVFVLKNSNARRNLFQEFN